MAKVTRLTLDSSGGLERRRLNMLDITEADAPLNTAGQDLRKAREQRGEDLAQVSAALKIRKDHLNALEESEMEHLPGRAYAIGFVRTYAAYLGLDPAEYVERLKAEIAGRSENKEDRVQLTPPRERKLPQGGLIFAAVLLIALAYGGYYVFVSASRSANQTATTPVPDRLAAQVTPPQDTSSSASLPLQSVTPEPAPAPAASAPVVPQSPAPTSAPAANAPVSGAAKVDETLPQGQRYGLQNANSRVTLRVHREGRVAVTGPDNRVFLGRVMQPGDTYQVPNIRGLKLSAADGGTVELIVDGNSTGFAAASGVETDNVSLNPQDIVDRRGAG